MNNNNIPRIQMIADKSLTYNKDINQHIESCRISLEIIKEKDQIINTLRSRIAIRDEQIRQLEEINSKQTIDKDKEENELRKIIAEQYKLIEELKRLN